MRIVIVYKVHQVHVDKMVTPYITMLRKAGVDAQAYAINDLVPEIMFGQLSVVVEMGTPVTADLIYFNGVPDGHDRDKLDALTALGIKVVNNPDAAATTANKHRCSVALAAAGLPVPDHLLVSDTRQIKNLMTRRFGEQMIYKPVSGSLGTGVALIHNAYMLGRIRIASRHIAQQYLPEGSEGDLRVFVINGTAVAAMRRVPARGEHRANLARGGKGFPHNLTAEEREVAERAATVLGLTFAGVDLIRTADGPVIIEVNSRPGHKIGEVTGVPVKELMVAELIRQAEQVVKERGNA